MFIKLTRSGPRTYLQIVEAYRDPDTGRPKQRHLATLGRLEHLQEQDVQGLLKGLQHVLGPESRGVASGEVAAAEASFEPALEVGPGWVLTQLWEQLELTGVLGRCCADRRRTWAVEPLIRLMVLNRLCEPSSKLGVLSWLERVYLPGVERAGVTHQRLLRAMDVLLRHQAAVETHLLRRLPAPTSVEVVFYDITTVRIHGEGEGGEDDLRCYGHSKDVQGVDRQFAVGMVQTADGFPVAHEVFRGNIGESTTVQGVVRGLCERFPIRRLIFIADRGMLSVENLEELEALTLADGRVVEYIVAVPVRRYPQLGDAVVALHPALLAASRARRGEVVRETTTAEGRRLVVAHSPAIAKRSRQRRAKRLRQVLQLAWTLEHKLEAQDRGKPGRGRRLTDTGAKVQLHQALAAHRVSPLITVHLDEPGYTWSWNVAALKRELQLDGKLVLISNVPDLKASTLIERYKELADIERGFRILKSQLDIAPVHHRLPDRLRAHTFICFLALVLQRWLRYRLRRHRPELSPETVLEQLRQVQYHSVCLASGQRFTNLTRMRPEWRALFEALEVEVPTKQALENRV